MRIIEGEVWLEYIDLLNVGVKEKTIKMGALRKSPQWQTMKDFVDKRKRFIRYETLDPKYKDAIKAKYCGGMEPIDWIKFQQDVNKQRAKQSVASTLLERLLNACETGYKKYQSEFPAREGKQLKSLSRAAAILVETAQWYKRNEISFSDYEAVKEVAKWVKDVKDEYFEFKYIPTYHLNLMEKLRAYAVEGKSINEVIVVPREGNNNRSFHKEEKWWKELAIFYRMDDRNFTQAQIFRKIKKNAIRAQKGYPSESILRQFIGKNEHLTVDAHSDLNNKRLQRHRTSMPMLKAMFSDDCWEMDGTQVQIVGHATGARTKDGKKEVKHLYVVGVRDVYSGAYLGWWYGYSESEHAYRSALKMAVDVTGRLPYELRYDQFPGSTSAGWKMMAGTKDDIGLLQKYGVKITKTSKSTGKAHAERGFYTLQQVFEAEKDGYIGHGIKSSLSHARPTESYILRTQKSLLNNGWNYEQAALSHLSVMTEYNHTPLSEYSRKHQNLTQSPWYLYENGLDECGKAIGALEISDLFWNARKEGIRNGKIEFTERGNTRRYYLGVNEFDLLEYQREGVTLTIRHDAYDFSEIMVFDNSGNFLAKLSESEGLQTYGKNADWEAVAKWKQEQKAITSKKKEKLSAYALSEETILLLPASTEKQVFNDAQSNYVHQNGGDWLPPKNMPKPKEKYVENGNYDDFDPEEFIFNQR